MTKRKQSDQNGVLKEGTTEPPQDSQSTNAENQFISVTLDTTHPISPNSQPIPNSQNERNNYARIIQAFAAKLFPLVEWKKVELGDGREGIALFFPLDKWNITTTNALEPKE